MEWMNDTCLQLIDEYEKHPILWNSLHPQYYNRTEKLEAWNIIAESFGISTDEVRRKMESLLGSYRGIKSRVRKRSEALGVFRESKWFAFNRLDQFMAKMKPDTTSTFEESLCYKYATDEIAVKLEPEEDPLISITSDNMPVESNVIIGENDSLPETSEVPPKKIRKIGPAHASNQTPPTCDSAANECELYGRYVAMKLQSYNKKVRSIVQYHINKALFQADMGTYDNDQYVVER